YYYYYLDYIIYRYYYYIIMMMSKFMFYTGKPKKRGRNMWYWMSNARVLLGLHVGLVVVYIFLLHELNKHVTVKTLKTFHNLFNKHVFFTRCLHELNKQRFNIMLTYYYYYYIIMMMSKFMFYTEKPKKEEKRKAAKQLHLKEHVSNARVLLG
ncbi:hypothetical protein ACJX0J_040304, partial [Zea mays]